MKAQGAGEHKPARAVHQCDGEAMVGAEKDLKGSLHLPLQLCFSGVLLASATKYRRISLGFGDREGHQNPVANMNWAIFSLFAINLV